MSKKSPLTPVQQVVMKSGPLGHRLRKNQGMVKPTKRSVRAQKSRRHDDAAD